MTHNSLTEPEVAEARDGVFKKILQDIVASIYLRMAIWCTVLSFFAIIVALRYVPYQWYWLVAFDVFSLYRYWPIGILLAVFYFRRAGARHYEKNGLPQYFPVSAAGVLLLFCGLIVVLLTDTAADWPLWWCLLALTLLLLAALQIMWSLIGHGELWRLWANAWVVSYVYNTLVERRFREKVQLQLPGQAWGSLHCLRIVRGYYDETKQKVLRFIEHNHEVEQKDLEACLEAGDDLWLYLSLRWPEQLLEPTELAWERRELLRELVTICFVARQQKQYATRINTWITLLNNSAEPYWQLLVLIFQISSGARGLPTSGATKAAIDQVLHLFQSLPPARHVHHSSTADLREICAHTWLALAHRTLPKQICFDVWMAMRGAEESLFVAPDSVGECDPAKIAARGFLATWYEEWCHQTPEDWKQGLAGRAVYVQTSVALVTQHST